MIKIENLITYGWEPALRGMRNPMESWDKLDSRFKENGVIELLGVNDCDLFDRLVKGGASHRKFLRQVDIYCDITACLKFWDEFDTYEFVVSNSTSQMHKIGSRFLTRQDFSEYVDDNILLILNCYIEKYQKEKNEINWRRIVDNVPQSFLYKRTVKLNYEIFLSMYFLRREHKMYEWRVFCKELRFNLPFMNHCIEILEKKKREG